MTPDKDLKAARDHANGFELGGREWAERSFLAGAKSKQPEIDELRKLLVKAKDCMQHTLDMGHLTPGGSQEGWYKEVFAIIDAALEGK